MSTNPTIKKLLDAGVAFTQMTQTKAEEIVRRHSFRRYPAQRAGAR
jgi:hypothetical protein